MPISIKLPARQLPEVDPDAPFQRRVYLWAAEAFGEKVAKIKRRVVLRFIEEACELAQSAGVAEHDIIEQARKVYAKPPDPLIKEIGGVITSFAALCEVHRIDMLATGERELAECYRRIDIIRQKEKAKSQ